MIFAVAVLPADLPFFSHLHQSHPPRSWGCRYNRRGEKYLHPNRVKVNHASYS